MFHSICAALILLLSLLLAPRAQAQVIISEVHWAGSDLSSADEWFELTALTEQVNVSNWYITSVNSSGEEKTIATFPANISLYPNSFYIVSNYEGQDTRLANRPDLVTSSVSLPNSKLQLRLYNASGSVIDEVDDGSGAPFAGSKTDVYSSMERIDFLASGRAETNWKSSTEFLGFVEGSPMRGTPGFANSTTSTSSSFSSSSVALPPILLPNIHITEVLANPEGSDDKEWIELYNSGTGSALLKGIKLQLSTKEFTFTDATLQLLPGEYIHMLPSYTGISLPNKGATIQLWYNNELLDEFEYAETAAGVSYGIVYNSLQPLCMPSPAKPNKKVEQKIIIEVQSGKTKGEGKTTLNLQAKALNGSINYVDCYWEYSDGFRSFSCNPPSHTFEDTGVFSVELRTNNICGDSAVEVLHGKVYEAEGISSASSSASSNSSKLSSSTSSSSVFSSARSSSSVSSLLKQLSYALELEVSELYPSPNSGEDEWIELYNPKPYPVEIAGWQLDDIAEGGSKPWQVPSDYPAIQSQKYALFYRANTKISLNNTGDDFRILDPNGTVQFSISYDATKKGTSILPKEHCQSIQPTPGSKNNCALAASKTTTKPTPKVQNITSTKTAYDTYVKSSYKNIVQTLAPIEEPKSSLLAKFEQNALPAGYIVKKQSKDSSMPTELLLYMLFVAPGWWFVTKRRLKG